MGCWPNDFNVLVSIRCACFQELNQKENGDGGETYSFYFNWEFMPVMRILYLSRCEKHGFWNKIVPWNDVAVQYEGKDKEQNDVARFKELKFKSWLIVLIDDECLNVLREKKLGVVELLFIIQFRQLILTCQEVRDLTRKHILNFLLCESLNVLWNRVSQPFNYCLGVPFIIVNFLICWMFCLLLVDSVEFFSFRLLCSHLNHLFLSICFQLFAPCDTMMNFLSSISSSLLLLFSIYNTLFMYWQMLYQLLLFINFMELFITMFNAFKIDQMISISKTRIVIFCQQGSIIDGQTLPKAISKQSQIANEPICLLSNW